MCEGKGLLWLGGRRDSENREDWVWSDGAPWGYTNWAEGEPNNHLGRNEDCALIYPDFGKKWNDFPCSSETTFVCKKGSMEENNNHTVSWNGKCVRDSSRPFRLLPTNAVPGYDLGGPFPSNTPARCKEACDDQGFLFAGVQTGHECWCGNDAPPQDRIVDMRECNVSCSGDSTLKCGGIWRMNVYKIEGETNQVSCPSGWSAYNGNCYKFVSKAKSFSEAEGYCNSIWDAHLASIHSAGENQFIYDSYGGQAGGDIWIGGKRQGDSFAWLDGTPWDYQNWSPNNPSHRHEECAEIFALNYYPSNWNDDSCSSRNAFVCQLTPAKGGPTTLPPRNCPKGWEGFQNSCYLYENETKTWEAARRHCIDLKADLVNIQSGEENDFISNFYSGAVYWIGLRRNETNSDSFVWTDGTAMTYSNWQSGQPDNWGTEEEECVVTGYLGPSFWNDGRCGDTIYNKGFVCEKAESGEEETNPGN